MFQSFNSLLNPLALVKSLVLTCHCGACTVEVLYHWFCYKACCICNFLVCRVYCTQLFILDVAVLIGCCLQLCGGKSSEGVFVGAFLSMSSTAVVKTLSKCVMNHLDYLSS